jgi:hypothetical protein
MTALTAFPLRKKLAQVSWALRGYPVAPVEHKKLRAVVENKGNRRMFVETGTGTGQMVNAVKLGFRHVISIELDKYLYDVASRKFQDVINVTILHGDSSIILPAILKGAINEPAVFWLDAHYSGGITAYNGNVTTVKEEVQAILAHPLAQQHVILIDDASAFGGCGWYPTLAEMRGIVEQHGMALEVRDDIIRITKR